MFRHSFAKVLLLVVVLVMTGGFGVLLQVNAQDTPDQTVLRVDIAEDGTRFRFDETFSFEEDGLPAYGSMFITQGYIYPDGTLNGNNGVLENGDPEFPDLVLGHWTCYGSFVGDGFHTESGPVVITTQVFQFGDQFSLDTIVSNGYELIDLNVPVARAITGGSGHYAAARGEQVQELLGITDYMAVNLRAELRLAP